MIYLSEFARAMTQELIEAVGYLRLSRDDGDDESSSITNQRAIINEWAERNGFIITKWYIDDGYSGYTMSRPDFNKLKQDLNENKVHTIIVKNLSRLGRHNAKVNLFLETIEEAGKRVLALGDGYDTFDEKTHEMVGIKTWINEKYVKDTSKNVRASIAKMQQEGRYISNVPYGYKLNPFTKGSYEVDPMCARYVQEIFDMYLSGYGVSAIAREFNKRNIPNYSEVVRQRLQRRGQQSNCHKSSRWYSKVIYDILKNNFYIGTLTLAKTKKRTINGKQIKQDVENLIVFENAHEPIIDKKTFMLAQDVLIERSRTNFRGQKTRTERNTFTGKMWCGECGARMVVTYSRVNKRYVCHNYHQFGTEVCSSHAIHEGIIKEVLVYFLEHCRENLSEAINDLDITIKNNTKDNRDVIYSLEKDLDRVNKELKILLEQKMRDIMAAPTMRDIIEKTYADMINEKSNSIKTLETQLNDQKSDELDSNDMKNSLKSVLDIFDEIITSKNITRRQVETIIDKLIIYEDGAMDIYLKGDLHELCTNYIQYKAADKDKIVGGILEYAKKFDGNIIPYRVEEYLKVHGRGVNRKTLKKIFRMLVDKGYLVENAGYHAGYSIVDMEEFECAYQNGNVINHSPRVKYNIVTFELINKIYAWAKTTKKVKKIF